MHCINDIDFNGSEIRSERGAFPANIYFFLVFLLLILNKQMLAEL